MALLSPLFMQNEDYPAADFRAQLEAATSGGILDAGDLKVTQRGAGVNMSVDVAAGTLIAPVTGQGLYQLRSTATENLTIAASPSFGNSRIDLVVATVIDTAYGGGSDEWLLEVVTGTPSGSPSAPATPAGSTLLATVTVVGSSVSVANSAIDDVRSYARAVTEVGSYAELANPSVGTLATVAGVLYIGNGGSWLVVPHGAQFKVKSGAVTRGLPTNGVLSVQGSAVTETVPAGVVNVVATFHGDLANSTGGASIVEGSCAVEISLDGGTSWTQGEEIGCALASVVSGTDPEGTISAGHTRSGVSTGSVHARLVTRRTPSDGWRIGGGLTLSITPG